MDLDTLTPPQRRVVEELIGWGQPRPRFDPNLPVRLRDTLESALAEIAADMGVGELFVNKRALNSVLGCETHHAADFDSPFPGWSPSRARGSVTHKAMELAIHIRGDPSPADVADAAIERLIADGGERTPGPWLADLGAAERAELEAHVVDSLCKFAEGWPPLERSWQPRTESPVYVELCDRRITLQSRVDLALGRALAGEARVLIVDFKTGRAYSHHLDDLRYYALVHTIRVGVPPYRVASYYLDASTFQPEDVTEELLFDVAMPRLLEGVNRLVELKLARRAPSLTPGPACGWCSLRQDCEGPAEWAARRPGFDGDEGAGEDG